MKVAFRVDSSVKIGTGHVRRCLTIADGLSFSGITEIYFICRNLHGNIIDQIKRQKFEVSIIGEDNLIGEIENYKESPNCPEGFLLESDARSTMDLIKYHDIDLIIVDSYYIDSRWEMLVKEAGKTLVVIDDLADREHQCDFLIDFNYSDIENRYNSITPKDCRRLLGTTYALISSTFTKRTSPFRKFEGLKRILIFFSGSLELHDLTIATVEALSAQEFLDIHLDVVVGGNEQEVSIISQKLSHRKKTSVYGPRLSLVDLMENVDLAIGAGGSTNWERFYMGLPAIVTAIAPNQVPSCTALAKAGYINFIEKIDATTPLRIVAKLRKLRADMPILEKQSSMGVALVDGLGLKRILISILPQKYLNFNLRRATMGDLMLYFDWVNDRAVRQSALNTKDIELKEHSIWFGKQLKSTSSFLYVFEVNNTPVGQVRFNKDKNEAFIDFSIAEFARGKQFGPIMLKFAIDEFLKRNRIRIRATVKKDNQPSVAVFRKLNFRELGRSEDIVNFEYSNLN